MSGDPMPTTPNETGKVKVLFICSHLRVGCGLTVFPGKANKSTVMIECQFFYLDLVLIKYSSEHKS